jgi:uncharacterized protein YegL
MTGDPIESVRDGINQVLAATQSDPQALETVWMSVITFDSQARQVTPLTAIDQFVPPKLESRGLTVLGQGISVLLDAISREVRLSTSTQKGDWRPLIFIFTDGSPTDAGWEVQADRLKSMPPGTVIAVGAGAQIDTGNLKRLSESVFLMRDATSENFKSFFKWVSDSIKVASVSAEQFGDSSSAAAGSSLLPPPPPTLELVP